MINKTIPLSTHYRPQLLIGLVLGAWLYFFLALVGPFDAAEVPLHFRISMMLGYGLVFFACYALLIPIQNKIYHLWGKWTLGYELALVVLFTVYSLPACFAYYKTEIVNGTLSFAWFSISVYLPTIVILLPVIFVGRYLIAKREKDAEGIARSTEVITLSGTNKLDVLNLTMADLVALEAANNYVTVHYLLDGQLRKKLLRSSLRKIQEMVPEMVQVHRSYLVNPQHFIEWQDGQTLTLTQLSVPVSQKYKAALLSTSGFAPK